MRSFMGSFSGKAPVWKMACWACCGWSWKSGCRCPGSLHGNSLSTETGRLLMHASPHPVPKCLGTKNAHMGREAFLVGRRVVGWRKESVQVSTFKWERVFLWTAYLPLRPCMPPEHTCRTNRRLQPWAAGNQPSFPVEPVCVSPGLVGIQSGIWRWDAVRNSVGEQGLIPAWGRQAVVLANMPSCCCPGGHTPQSLLGRLGTSSSPLGNCSMSIKLFSSAKF